MFEKVKIFVKKVIRFLTYDLWRLTGEGISSQKTVFYNALKAFILTLRNIDGAQLSGRASALTYSTVLSIVPLLAVLFAVARGFSFDNTVQKELLKYSEGQSDALTKAMSYIDSTLAHAQNGVFMGVGIILLLYTVISLFWTIEDNFNYIWSVKKGRSYFRLFTDYLALFIILPIFLVCDAGLTIALNTASDVTGLGWVTSPIMMLAPFFVIIILFTFLYGYIPNTKVKFSAALFGGIVAGILFQLFQTIYINGQIWISKYNAIYGSFAAIPLLLLWLQLSWFICLFGVQLSFSFQNVKKFDFEHESKNISHRYRDFVFLLVATLIVKRFEKGDTPYMANDLSENYKIPTQLTNEILYRLEKAGIILETSSDKDRLPAYIPAIDIHKISIEYLYDKLDMHGTEDFVIDIDGEFKNVWDTILNIRKTIKEYDGKTLLKDLLTE